MAKEIKFPRVVVGAFIFNERNELFLTKGVKWHNKYVCVGGRVEAGEKIEDTLEREVKEETNMKVEDFEFIGVVDGFDVHDKYTVDDDHLIFLDYKVKAKSTKKIKLNDEASSYKWLPVEKWLKKEKKEFAPYTYEVIERLNKTQENFEHKYKLALADYQNLLKRTAEEKAEFAKYANQELVMEILPVYDNLKLALEHVDESPNMLLQQGSGQVNNVNESVIIGIKHIIKQFSDVLASLGVEEIKTKGEKFDPETMEALEGKGKKVKKEVKAGYKLNGKVIVPAKVILE